MPSNLKTYFPHIASIAAIIMSGFALYVDFFRSMDLDFYVSRHAYISNTVGGVPDINLTFSVRGNGPLRKAVALDSARIILKRTDTGKTYNLMSNPRYENLPTIIEGGDVATFSPLLVVDDSLSDTIKRNDDWCNTLKTILPNELDSIEEICYNLKKPYIGSSDSEHSQMEDSNIDESIKEILKKIPVEHIQRVLFFTSGNYEMEISLIKPSGESFGTETYKFSIDSIFSQSLMHNFNLNALLTIEKSS